MLHLGLESRLDDRDLRGASAAWTGICLTKAGGEGTMDVQSYTTLRAETSAVIAELGEVLDKVCSSSEGLIVKSLLAYRLQLGLCHLSQAERDCALRPRGPACCYILLRPRVPPCGRDLWRAAWSAQILWTSDFRSSGSNTLRLSTARRARCLWLCSRLPRAVCFFGTFSLALDASHW